MSTARPMDPSQRALGYLMKTGRIDTPRQRRRRRRKIGHLAALERRDGHVEVASATEGEGQS